MPVSAEILLAQGVVRFEGSPYMDNCLCLLQVPYDFINAVGNRHCIVHLNKLDVLLAAEEPEFFGGHVLQLINQPVDVRLEDALIEFG